MINSRSRRRLGIGALGLVALAASACGGESSDEGGSADTYPSEQLNWTVASGAGGGSDLLTRLMAEILKEEELYTEPIVVTNREGGDGAIGWGHTFNAEGDPYELATLSTSMITTPLVADTPWDVTDFTHITIFGTDSGILVVPGADGPKSLQEFVANAKEDPPSIGMVNATGPEFLLSSIIAEETGFEFESVPFAAMGEVQTALLSGSIDAAVGEATELMGLIESGDVKPLVYGGSVLPTALEGVVPTLQDEGVDASLSTPRGFVMPPGVTPEERDWWVETMKKAVQTPEWKEYLDDNLIAEETYYGEDAEKYASEVSDTFERILEDAGAL